MLLFQLVPAETANNYIFVVFGTILFSSILFLASVAYLMVSMLWPRIETLYRQHIAVVLAFSGFWWNVFGSNHSLRRPCFHYVIVFLGALVATESPNLWLVDHEVSEVVGAQREEEWEVIDGDM